MKYIIDDKKYHFKSAFDTISGAYVRTGILDENGKDTAAAPAAGSAANPSVQKQRDDIQLRIKTLQGDLSDAKGIFGAFKRREGGKLMPQSAEETGN